MPEHMIEAKKIWKSYGDLQVLKDLDLNVIKGETLVILGRSGVGKSVLLRQIIGIEKPDRGEVIVHGKNLWTLPTKERDVETMKMGMLFQGAALFDSMNVRENVAFYLRQHHPEIPEEEIRLRVAEALEMVDLNGTEEVMPSDLSGGMKKRAALARLVVYRPQILLYDEPTTGLDPITAMQINRLIISTQHELQATSIVVTHDLLSAMTVGDRLAFHDGGKIPYVAPKKEFLQIDDPHLKDFFEDSAMQPEWLEGRGGE